MEHATVIRELVFQIVTHATALTELIEVSGVEVSEERLVADAVDSAAAIGLFYGHAFTNVG
jgi:hypothetical protein